MKRKLCFMASPCLSRKPFLGGIGIAVGVIIFCLFFNTRAYPQMALSIGDKLPDVTVQNVIHYSNEEVKLSEYKGKLLILDFWATWCSPCISMLPKTDSLQKVFKDQVMFLPVTYQSKEEVNKLLSRSKKLGGLSLPIATSDKTLHLLFPHKELPHYVWIDENGIVKAITSHNEVNALNIRAMLAEKKSILPEKRDVLIRYDREQPLLIGNLKATKERIKYETLLCGYIDGQASQYTMEDHPNGSIRHTFINYTLANLFCKAWSEGTIYFGNNRIVSEVNDPDKVSPSETGKAFLKQWMAESSYCYEIIAPAHLTGNAYDLMRQDMFRLFPQYKVTVEKRKRPCLVLVRTSSQDKIKSKGLPSTYSFEYGEGSMVNCSLNLLVTQLNIHDLQLLSTPVIDGTNYNQNVDLRLEANFANVESLRKALQAYDLDLVTKDLEIDVVVIRDAH